jgi:hypothetical protein
MRPAKRFETSKDAASLWSVAKKDSCWWGVIWVDDGWWWLSCRLMPFDFEVRMSPILGRRNQPPVLLWLGKSGTGVLCVSALVVRWT